MIDGLSLEYAYARICACLSRRPDERLWLRLRSARSIPALLETVRGSAAADSVSGIPVTASGDVIELAFRQQLRSRIDDVASWAPPEWREALRFTRFLADLPALVHLLSDESPARWLAVDPELAPYALESLVERRRAIAAGPLAHIADALNEEVADARSARRDATRGARGIAHAKSLHAAVTAWIRQWRNRWPAVSHETSGAIVSVIQAIERHLHRFGVLAVDDAQATRLLLSARLTTLLRRFPAQPAALFAYLAVFALDLESLRGEFVRRARPIGVFA
jgi:hypothetical protein